MLESTLSTPWSPVRPLSFAILLASLACSACALNTGVAPSERAAQAASQAADVEASMDTDASADPAQRAADAQGEADETSPATPPGSGTPSEGVWPATYTTTLQGAGWTLTPLGAQRGVSGTLSAPDGSLHLEALP